MFRDRVDRIAADVGYSNAVLAAVVDINHVGAGRGDGDQLERRYLCQDRRAQRDLVGDDDVCSVRQPFGKLLRRRPWVFDPVVRKIGSPHDDLRRDRRAVEEDDRMVTLAPVHALEYGGIWKCAWSSSSWASVNGVSSPVRRKAAHRAARSALCRCRNGEVHLVVQLGPTDRAGLDRDPHLCHFGNKSGSCTLRAAFAAGCATGCAAERSRR